MIDEILGSHRQMCKQISTIITKIRLLKILIEIRADLIRKPFIVYNNKTVRSALVRVSKSVWMILPVKKTTMITSQSQTNIRWKNSNWWVLSKTMVWVKRNVTWIWARSSRSWASTNRVIHKRRKDDWAKSAVASKALASISRSGLREN